MMTFPICLCRVTFTLVTQFWVFLLYTPSPEACLWLETRDPLPPWQRICCAERPGLGHRVRGSCGGGEWAGQVWAGHLLLQNGQRAHHHPRYYFHHLTPKHPHTHRPQCTKAATVTRKTLLLVSLTVSQILFKALWLWGLTWIICLCLLCVGAALFSQTLISELVTKRNVHTCPSEVKIKG